MMKNAGKMGILLSGAVKNAMKWGFLPLRGGIARGRAILAGRRREIRGTRTGARGREEMPQLHTEAA